MQMPRRAQHEYCTAAVSLIASLTLLLLTAPAASAGETSPSSAAAGAAHATLPLSFVANAGQTDARVRYVGQSAALNVYFTDAEAVLLLARREGTLVLRLEYVNAAHRPAISGGHPGAGRVHYLKGRDPARWRTDLKMFGQLRYHDLWRGIDMTFGGGDAGRLKYEFLVAAGADVRDIRLRYRGATALALDRDGSLVVQTARGNLTDTRPIAYQVIGGTRVPVESRFVLHGGTEFGFATGSFDRTVPLVIDPGIVYSTYLGGTGDDTGHAVAVDPAGHAYVTGNTYSLDFPTTAGAVQPAPAGSEDVFVAKFDQTGTALVYSTYLGGSGSEPFWSASIAVDPSGHAYIAGSTTSPDFPTTPGAFQSVMRASDAFVAKLSRDGSALLYSTLLGGSAPDGAFNADAIAVDPSGHAYVTGFTDSPDFPTRRAYDATFNGVEDVFVTKMNKTGTALVYSTFLGGSDWDVAGGIAIDAAGRAAITGYTYSPDYPVRNAVQPVLRGGTDAFVTRLTSTGDALIYSTFFGGSGASEGGYGIDVDNTGTAFVAGFTDSVDFPVTPDAYQTVYAGGAADGFVARFAPAGAIGYSTYYGGAADDFATNVAVDPRGRAHAVGFTNSPDLPVTPNAAQPAFRGAGPPWMTGDAFVARFNPSGNDLEYGTYLGGSLDETGLGIALHPSGDIYVTGSTSSPDFPVANAFDPTFNGAGPPYFYGDAYVTRLAAPKEACRGRSCSGRRD